MLLMDKLLLASAPNGAATVGALDPVAILLKPALSAFIRGPKALQTALKCPRPQIRKGAEWNTLKHFFVEELLGPAGCRNQGDCMM